MHRAREESLNLGQHASFQQLIRHIDGSADRLSEYSLVETLKLYRKMI